MLRKLFYLTRHPYAWLSVLALAALLVLAGCGGTTTGTGATSPTAAPTATTSTATATATTASTGNAQSVTIMTGASGFAFSPATLTLSVGTTVTWHNSTSAPHTVTSDDGKAFNSGDTPIAPGGTFSFTFTTPGTFAYHCNIHPSMKATIIVK